MEAFDWYEGFWTPTINFIIFMSLAIFFFKKPLAAMAAKRKEEYMAAFKLASEAKIEAEAKIEELDQKLATLDQKVSNIKAQAEAEAKREADRILASANQLADHLHNEAQQIAETEVRKAKKKLRAEVINQVRLNVENKLKTDLSVDIQHQIIKKNASNINQLDSRG